MWQQQQQQHHQQFILAMACIIVQLQESTPSTTIAAIIPTTITTAMLTESYVNEVFFSDYDVDELAELEAATYDLSVYTLLVAGGVQLPITHSQNYVHHMVSLRSRHRIRNFGDNHFCAGTIIAANIVLTAAHCIMDKRGVLTRPRRMLVIAGTPRRTQFTNTTLRFEVAELLRQPKFQRDYSNQVALVRIKGAFPHGNPNVRQIYLPRSLPPYDHNCTMIGWGRMYYRGPLSDAALHVNVTLLQPSMCQQLRSDVNTQGLLCAINALEDYESDTCPGDTGGPLICNGKLTGLIAWNLLCGNISIPSLFIDVQPQINWILSVMTNGGSANALIGQLIVCPFLIVLLI